MGIEHEGEILLKIQEAADQLSVSNSTVRRLCDQGALVRRKPHGKRFEFVTLDSVLSYEKALKLTDKELAARLIRLERKVDAIVRQLGVDLSSEMEDILREHHPHVLRS